MQKTFKAFPAKGDIRQRATVLAKNLAGSGKGMMARADRYMGVNPVSAQDVMWDLKTTLLDIKSAQEDLREILSWRVESPDLARVARDYDDIIERARGVVSVLMKIKRGKLDRRQARMYMASTSDAAATAMRRASAGLVYWVKH